MQTQSSTMGAGRGFNPHFVWDTKQLEWVRLHQVLRPMFFHLTFKVPGTSWALLPACASYLSFHPNPLSLLHPLCGQNHTCFCSGSTRPGLHQWSHCLWSPDGFGQWEVQVGDERVRGEWNQDNYFLPCSNMRLAVCPSVEGNCSSGSLFH